MRYTEFKYMEQEDDCGTESHSNGSSSDIREKRESGYHCSGDAGIERLEGGNILNMSVEKKWHRWIAIAVALLMLVTLAMPMNVSKASAATTNLQNPRTASDETVTWDCVWFGRYPQSAYEPKQEPENPNEEDIYTDPDGTKFVYLPESYRWLGNPEPYIIPEGYYKVEPIKWRVLSVKENEALLLADKLLDVGIPYNETLDDVTWENCTMRSWLNGYGSGFNQNGIDYTSDNFIDRAFTANEKNAILQKTVENADNPYYGTEGGNNTSDKLFLPSIEEITNLTYGFSIDKSDPYDWIYYIVAVNTAYKAGKSDSYNNNEGERDFYWLRSPGYYSGCAAVAGADHNLDNFGVSATSNGVRPALRLNLNSNFWSYAGTVEEDAAPGGGDTTLQPGYKPVEDVNMTTPGDSGSIRLFQDAGGSIGNAPITKIFPGDYSLKFPMIQTGVAKESMEDGTYKYKMTIGLDENMAFGSAKAWGNLKKDFADAKKNLDRINTLNTLMKKWGASRGSFNLTKSFKAKPDMEIAGYYEAICDENGRVISDSGGVLLSAKWSASTTNQFLAGPVPLYLELGGSLKAVGKGGLERTLQDSNLSLTGTVTVSPGLSLEGGVGVSGVATVGAKGDADVAIQLVPWSKGTFHGGASITAKLIFVFDWEYSVLKVTCPIWDNTRQAKMDAFFTDEAAIKELSLTDRSYQKYTTQWKGQPAASKNSRSLARTQSEDSGAAAWELQGYVLPDTIPQMKQAGDDTVLVFQSNDAQRNTQNSTKLMYSVYDGSAWSQPKALWDNGTLDTFADLELVGDELYVVWQKCREPMTGSDVSELSQQAAKSSEICWAKYDPEKKNFGTSRYLTDNSLPDTMPVLAEDTETPTVMWVQNNKADLTGLTGTKTIWTSQLTGTQWSEPEKVGETDAYLSQLVGISQDGTEKAAYLGSPASGGLPAVYLAENGTETQIAKSEETPISGLGCGDGAITYKKDGVLEQYQIADGTLSQWKAGQSQSVGSNARVYEQNGTKMLLWMTNEGDGCTFYASVKTEDGYSEPIEVYQNETLQGNYFTAQPAKNGGWEIVLNASETENEEKTSLYFIQTECQPKVELGDVVLNENEMEGANQPFAYSVTNDSEETITQFQLTVKDGTKVLVDKTICQTILPGETVYLEDTLELSDVQETANLTIQVMAPGQRDSVGSSREQAVQMADLEVAVEKTVLDKSVRFTATVTNTGKVASDGDVILYGDAEGSRKIASRHFDSIAPGETASVELEYPVSSMIFQGEESAYCMVQAVTDKEEFNAGNNTYYGATYLWELPEDNFQIAGFALSGAGGTYTYTGKEIRPAVTVKGLTAGKDYTVSYRNNVNAGTAQVVVTGIGRYHGTMVKEFTIRKASQSVTAKSFTKTYGNKAFSLGAKAKTKLSYKSSNKNVATVSSTGKVTLKGPGKATITITAAATNNYNAASKSITITVKPKKATLKKAKSTKKRTLKVMWKRDTKATGYQVVIAQNKKFKKGKKTALIKKNKTTSKTFKKLKSRKNYYYKVRAYKQVGKAKIYGSYSKAKRIKVK